MNKLVQAIYYEGFVLLFMENGKIYRMELNHFKGDHTFTLIGEIPNEPR